MSKVGKESEDVTRATENVTALKAQLSELEAQMQADAEQVAADWDLSKEPFDRVLVKPKRGGVSVQLVALVWVPA
jgi:predicted phage tail protein